MIIGLTQFDPIASLILIDNFYKNLNSLPYIFYLIPFEKFFIFLGGDLYNPISKSCI